MQRYLGVIEDAEQLALSGVEPGQQTVQGDIASLSFEDAIEAGSQLGGPSPAGILLVDLEVVVELPGLRPLLRSR